MLVENIKSVPLTKEAFNELLKEFYFEGRRDGYVELLQSIIKAEVGGVLDRTNPTPDTISFAVFQIKEIFNFIRALTIFTDRSFTLSSPEYRGVIGLVDDLVSIDIQCAIMDSFSTWCYYSMEYVRTVEYATKLTSDFKILISLLNLAHNTGMEISNKN